MPGTERNILSDLLPLLLTPSFLLSGYEIPVVPKYPGTYSMCVRDRDWDWADVSVSIGAVGFAQAIKAATRQPFYRYPLTNESRRVPSFLLWNAANVKKATACPGDESRLNEKRGEDRIWILTDRTVNGSAAPFRKGRRQGGPLAWPPARCIPSHCAVEYEPTLHPPLPTRGEEKRAANNMAIFDPWPSLSRFSTQDKKCLVFSPLQGHDDTTTLQTRRAIKPKALFAQGPQASWRAYSALYPYLHLDLVRPPSIHPGKCGSFAEEPSWSSWGTAPHSRLGPFLWTDERADSMRWIHPGR
ncbi:hypothetical protein CPLU01_03823 [Colletotrichum plurivorum]|uniref:Uncharacterized protein n=1 Tax=Colletotrichum plurivorum TaxID=2175906 RepID=A0A8H6KR13_9PEZI|nr:hypothetical protein CPLU01_03823 [Colletotrichum plurivorum]